MAKKAISHINLIGALLVVVVFVFILSIIQEPSADSTTPPPLPNIACTTPTLASLAFTETNSATVGQNLISFAWENVNDPLVETYTLEINKTDPSFPVGSLSYDYTNTATSPNPFIVKNTNGGIQQIPGWSTISDGQFFWRVSSSGTSCDTDSTLAKVGTKTTTSTSGPIESRTLSAGWNLIAPRGTVSSSNINGALSIYSNNPDSWYWSLPGMTTVMPSYIDLDQTPAYSKILSPGQGYWVYSQNGGTYSLANVATNAYTAFTGLTQTMTLDPSQWTQLGNPFTSSLSSSQLSVWRDSGTSCTSAAPCSYVDAKNIFLISSLFTWDPQTNPPTGAWKILGTDVMSIPSGQGFFIKNKTTGTLHFKMQSS